MDNFIENLCGAERDRVTAAEICIDELLTILDRHGTPRDAPIYLICQRLSASLHKQLTKADGLHIRRGRLIRIRQALTMAFPMTDEDLVAQGSEANG